MKKSRTGVWVVLLTVGAIAIGLWGASGAVQSKLPKDLAGLKGSFNLAGDLKPEVRYYIQETQFIHFGFNGKRTGAETYTIKMRLVPAKLSGKGGDEYTVREVSVKQGSGATETIPALAGWSYVFKVSPTGRDAAGQVLGIPHDKFENLVTSGGTKITPAGSYPIYNSFIDFHTFNDVFARPTVGGGGIQDLKAIGQTIHHQSAFSEPPVNVGKGIKEGSVFRNGDIRLVFKGVSLVDEAACAVIGYDSGESTLKMIVPVSADKDIVTEGGSEYAGDIYIDLATRWVRKVTLDEHVFTETQLPATGAGSAAPGQKFQAYTVRHILTRMVGRDEYEK